MKPRDTHLYMPRGDAKIFPFSVDEDIAGMTFAMDLRWAEGDTTPVVSLTSANGGIAITDAAKGYAEMRIPASATGGPLFARPAVLLWDLQVITGAGPETLLSGRLHVYPDVTHD